MPPLARRLLALLASALCLLACSASAAHAEIYWVNNDTSTIGRAANAGSGVNKSFTPAGATLGGGVVTDGRHLYWSLWGGRIARANLDGSGVDENFVTTGQTTSALAIDSGHLYWAAPNDARIGRANLDGSGVAPDFVATAGGGSPGGVAVDGAKVYWTDTNLGTIGSANLDGGAVDLTLLQGLDTPQHLTVDGGWLYWANTGQRTIGRVRTDGFSANWLWRSTSDRPDGVAVSDGYVYWSEPMSNRIGRALISNGSGRSDFITGLDWPQGLVVTAPGFSASPSAAAFGNVLLGRSGSQTVTVTNSASGPTAAPLTFGSGAVTLSGANANQFSITTDGCSDRSIAPSATCDVTLAFTPTTVGSKSASIRFADNAAGSPQALTLSGHGTQAAVSVTAPAGSDYGEQRVGAPPALKDFLVDNTASGPDAGAAAIAAGGVTLIGADPDEFTIVFDNCSGRTIAPASGCFVRVGFAPTAEGAASATLSIADDAPGSPRTVSLTGTGVAPLLSLDPLSHEFGAVLVGERSAAVELTLSNDGTGPATLPAGAVALAGADAAAFTVADDDCSGATLAAGAECAVAVVFAPTAAGAAAATLEIADGEGATLSAALSGSGRAPVRPDPDPDPRPDPDPDPRSDPDPRGDPLPVLPLPLPPSPPAPPAPVPPTQPAPAPGSRSPPRRAAARPRLSASVGGGGAAVVVGGDGSVRLRCALAGAALRGCAAVAAAIDGETLGSGAVRAGTGGRAATVAVRLDARGRARLATALGGVRAVVTVTATTRDGRRVVKRLRVTLLAKRQQVVTRAGAFAPDGAALTPTGVAFLRDVARRLRGVRAIVCTGFTATRGEQGSDAAAEALGLARGRAACALLRRLGVDVRLSARSGGRSAPLAGNESEAGRDRNRRVELTIVR